jgi:hypothetical protein
MIVGRQDRGIARIAAHQKETFKERSIGGRQFLATRFEAGDKSLGHDGLYGYARDKSSLCAQGGTDKDLARRLALGGRWTSWTSSFSYRLGFHWVSPIAPIYDALC